VIRGKRLELEAVQFVTMAWLLLQLFGCQIIWRNHTLFTFLPLVKKKKILQKLEGIRLTVALVADTLIPTANNTNVTKHWNKFIRFQLLTASERVLFQNLPMWESNQIKLLVCLSSKKPNTRLNTEGIRPAPVTSVGRKLSRYIQQKVKGRGSFI